jgi:hypothetical protein
MGLPSDFPKRAGLARDKYLLAALDDGRITPVWHPLRVAANSHVAVFQVLSDALKLDGVRLSTSAYNLQQIADKLGASLMTPRLIDWCFRNADVVIPPQTIYPPDDSSAALEKESQKIEDAILAATGGVGLSYGGLLAPIGKNWCLSNVLVSAAPKHAALYGWACKPGYTPPPGVMLHKGTLTGISNIQPLATPHDQNYSDYAMLISLVRRDCTLDGVSRDLHDLLQSADPTVWSLVSHEGPLRLLRQPGVPILPALPSAPTNVPDGRVAMTSGALTYAPTGPLPWGYAKNGKPLPVGTQIQIAHTQAADARYLRRHPHHKKSNEFFWHILSIPLTTIAGITIGKLIERHGKKVGS